MEEESVFAAINNIPSNYHSCDLRNFFSQFIETDGFECFHFRHRPEFQKNSESGEYDNKVLVGLRGLNTSESKTIQENSGSGNLCKRETQYSDYKTKKKLCCVVKLKYAKFQELKKTYNRCHWLDRKGDLIPALCIIQLVNVKTANNSDTIYSKYMTRGEQKNRLKDKESFSRSDLHMLPELNPPVDVMPNGNVGTPTKVFLTLIQQCKLPPAVIKKLGLSFPRTRSIRRYGNVNFEYDTTQPVQGRNTSDNEQLRKSKSSTKACKSSTKKSKASTTLNSIEDSASEEDDCEEWERHEALQDDPTNVERNKQPLYEEQIELKWEKGGSGLVFYTDAQFWREREDGDFDEQTADDWDIDMSVYYHDNGGDMDSQDLVSMRQEERRRYGTEDTDMRTAGFMSEETAFEKHSKGVGSRVLKKHGWREGQGLGCSIGGITKPLDADGQKPSDKRGFGYHGEKLQRDMPCFKKAKRESLISTVYDDPYETDPREPLLRRLHHHHIKYRQTFQKAKQFQ